MLGHIDPIHRETTKNPRNTDLTGHASPSKVFLGEAEAIEKSFQPVILHHGVSELESISTTKAVSHK
jgi:hypothetical protein